MFPWSLKMHLSLSYVHKAKSSTILSPFVTYGHVIQPDQTWDKHGVLTPKINLLVQKSLKQKLRTADVF